MLHRWVFVTALVSAACAFSTFAEEPTYDELRQQLRDLQQRVTELERRQAEPSSTVESTRASVAKDAAERSRLLPSSTSINAGYDKGFFIRSGDGNFVFRPGVQMQFRDATNYRADGGGDTQNGFELRRLRLRLEGNVFTQDLNYSFVWDTIRSTGGVSLLDAWAQYRFAPQWSVKAGQFRESWTHEGDVPDMSQLAVDRSMIDSLLGGSLVDRVQGVSLIYGSRSTPLRIETTFHDGANSKNTDFRDQEPSAIPGNPPIFDENFGFGGRVEYKAFGEWPDYRDFTAKGTKAPLLVFGGGFDFTEAGDTNVFLPTADAQYENPNGFAAYAALHGALTNTSDNDRFDYGGLIQASYLFTPAWELFGRYNAVFTDSPGDDVFSEATVGVNYYFGPNGSYVHRAKFTLDLNYLPNGAPLNITQIDALAGSENQFIVRAQLTLQL